jgi:hypothetical protein
MPPKTPDDREVTNQLSAEDKALFLETWDLKEGEMSDDEILLSINLGHL